MRPPDGNGGAFRYGGRGGDAPDEAGEADVVDDSHPRVLRRPEIEPPQEPDPH